MGEDVLFSPLLETLLRGVRKFPIPLQSKEEKVIPPILKFVGTRLNALVEVATQVMTLIIAQTEQFGNMGISSSIQEPMLTREWIKEVMMDASPRETRDDDICVDDSP